MPVGADGSAKVIITMSFTCDSYREANQMDMRLRRMLTEYAAGKDEPRQREDEGGGATPSSSASASTHQVVAAVAAAAATHPESAAHPPLCTDYVDSEYDEEMLRTMSMLEPIPVTLLPEWPEWLAL